MKLRQLLYIALGIFFIGNSFSAEAQDGESLFNDKCKACHHPDKKGVGPALRDIRKKWAENTENTDLIYEWVRNWKAAAEMGDPYVSELPNTFPGEMNPIDLTNEEIDAVLDYADNFVEKKASKSGGGGAAPAGENGEVEEVKTIPNYEQNMKIIGVSTIITIVLIIMVLTLATSIRSTVQSDIYKQKIAERYNKSKGNDVGKKILTILIILLPTIGFSQLPGEPPEPNETFFKFTNGHVWIAITINLILLGVVLYLKSVLVQILEAIGIENKRYRFFRKRKITFGKAITNVVPIEKEKDILMDHEYDGIQELDNVLPPWWLWMFYLTIVFGVVFIMHFHVFKTGDLQYEAYHKEQARAKEEIQKYLDANAMNITAETAELLTDPESISKGKQLFSRECVTCHGDKGQGGTGANLTDDYWIYGNQIGDVFNTISNGGNNGMQPWNSTYNPKQIQLIASYVLSLDEYIGPEDGGKAPEDHAVLMTDDANNEGDDDTPDAAPEEPIIDDVPSDTSHVINDTTILE